MGLLVMGQNQRIKTETIYAYKNEKLMNIEQDVRAS